MLGSTPIAAVLGAAPDPTAPTAQLKSFAKTAASVGLALLLVAPGQKIPVDMRSPIQRRKDDTAAQEAAKAAGRSDWHKAKSLAGSHLATTDGAMLGRYIDKYRKTYGENVAVNFAIECGRSNIVVVDCDTTEQKHAFLDDYGVSRDVAPTVCTPGKIDENGVAAHYDGGHFYFTVPEGVELSAHAGTYTQPGGDYAIMWRDRYVLIPPSVRAEGAYVQTGMEFEVFPALVEKINTYGELRRPRTRDEMSDDDLVMSDSIDEWAESISWAEILAPYGWLEAGRPDNCGCDVWTAPGDHGSPKSATTHTNACTLDRYTTINVPMHIWTDKPGEDFEAWIANGGSKTITKLQAVAITQHGGDVGEAMNQHDLIPSGGMDIDVELGVSANNMGDAAETNVANMDDDIVLPADTIVPGTRDAETIRAALQGACPHGSVSKIGVCFACGVKVLAGDQVPAPATLPEPVTDVPEFMPCDFCESSFLASEFYVNADGEAWHAQPDGEDHEAHNPYAECADDEDGPPHVQVDGPDPDTRHEPAPVEDEPAHVDYSNDTVFCNVCYEDVPASETFAPPGRSLHHRRNGYHETGVDTRGQLPHDPEPTPEPVDVPSTSVVESDLGQASTPPVDLFDLAGAALTSTASVPTGDGTGGTVPLVDAVIENYDVLRSSVKGVPIIAPFDHWRGMPAPEYIVEDLIEHRGLSCIIGAPGTGKSAVAIDIACSIVTGQRWQTRKTIKQKVLYLPGEGMSGAVQRIEAWEKAHGQNVGQDLLVGDSIIQLGAEKDAWATLAQFIVKHRVGLIIFDTFARMSLGLDENSATDVGKAVKRFDQIRQITEAGVLIVHHTGKSGESARGSSALNGALDSEIKIVSGNWETDDGIPGTPITLHTTKQKNAEMIGGEGMHLLLSPMHDSVVVTNASGKVGDPINAMDGVVSLTPEPVVETAIRIRKYIDRLPKQGATRGEIVLAVEMDPYLAKRKNADIAWKLRVSEAVDAALRFELIETLTGTASGARYIPGPYGHEAARKKAAEEIITD